MSFDRFRGSARPSLGVELELQLVDARSMALAGAIGEILAGVPAEFQGSIKPEFYDCCVEINTGICRDVAEAEQDLAAKLTTTTRIAGGHGVLLAWGGTHPFSHWRDQPVVPTPRYRELAGLYRETLCRQLTFGLHVHVGVGDGDAAVRVCNRIAEHLPALLALSANSPFWCGRATGLHAHRVEVMGASPTGGLPPRLDGWGDYVRLVDRLTAAGLIRTPQELWWDVRPSPDHGTVEIRMCDMPPDLPSVLGLAALTQCLVVELARGDDGGSGLDECGLMIVRQNRWRAARFGLGAGLVDPRTGRPSPAREVIQGLVQRLRGAAEALACARPLGLVRAMADGPGGAERQLAVFERTGDLLEVVRRQMIQPAAISPALTGPELPVVEGIAAVNGSWPVPASIAGTRGTPIGGLNRASGAAPPRSSLDGAPLGIHTCNGFPTGVEVGSSWTRNGHHCRTTPDSWGRGTGGDVSQVVERGPGLEEEAPRVDGASKDHRVGQRRLPVGAEVLPAGGVGFRVWAPRRREVAVIVQDSPGGSSHDGSSAIPLEAEEGGYFSGLAPGAGPGALYRYQLDGGGTFPDPASRFQPEGPHGPSQVVDPGAFAWTDTAWRGLQLQGQVLYEMHVSTFTAEGTWEAASRELAALKELGITCVEVMPVAEFPGRFGWGYDGVDLFAPSHLYGTPDDFRRFVDDAHRLGLGVILDVVYNHLGPDGAYHKEFSEDYYDRHRAKTEWGDALNFDGENCGPVREFFVANAGYWIDEFHLDGLRLDATQMILDDSPDHVLAMIARHARASAHGRSILLIAEDESQDTIRIRPPEQGGYGLDAQWNDDFHHSAVVALTGRSEAYYSDYLGTPQELISALKWGFLFQGQYFNWQKKARGSSTYDLPAPAFITYLENHDQVSNSARGDRLRTLTSPAQYKAMAAIWLLAPGTPMLFQGQEFGATNPFLYFADHVDDLARLVHKGRLEFLAQFRSIAHPDLQRYLPDPGAPETFVTSKLDRSERAAHAEVYALHRDLLRLRREDPIFRAQRADRLHGAVIGPEAFVLRYFGAGDDCRLVLANLGRDLFPNPTSEPLVAPPRGCRWDVLWYSEHPRYGGCGAPPFASDEHWRIPGRATIVLKPGPKEGC